MNFEVRTLLGKTGLMCGRLGISSSFGAPASLFEEAFERGCNYFTWGTFIKGRSNGLKKTVLNLTKQGKRNNLIISMLTYAHNAYLTERYHIKGLKALGIEYTDILLLGYFPKRPSQRVIDGALKLKEKGLVKFIGITSHNRKLFPELYKENIFDVFHIRYNAAHRGAETEAFPYLTGENKPGIVSFTATDWRKLLNPRKMPSGESPPTAAQCYQFVLSNPSVDICMMGAKNRKEMRENLSALDVPPMNDEELQRMQRIGDHVYGKK